MTQKWKPAGGRRTILSSALFFEDATRSQEI